MKQNEYNEVWKLYQKGVEYNDALDYVNKVQTNERFIMGDQWKGVKANGLPTPVFNILKRPLYHFIAFLISSPRKVKFMSDSQDLASLNKIFERNWELDKMDDKVKRWLKKAGISGDMVCHTYWDQEIENDNGIEGDYVHEIVDGTNLFLGNPNRKEINIRGKMYQPYVLLTGRETVNKLKEEARENEISKEEIDLIRSDEDNERTSSDLGKIEIENNDKKATYVIKYWFDNKTGTVHSCKATQNSYIWKDKDIRNKMCPVALENWEERDNSYHGEGFATQLIPAQKYINKQYALVMIHTMLLAMPTRIYDKTKITKWTNQVGASIGVNGSINDVAKVIEGTPVPAGVMGIVDSAKQSTNESIGVNDVLLGNITPTNASAIVQVVEQSSTTLLNQSTALNNFLENIAEIDYEFIRNYYGEVARNYSIENSEGKVEPMSIVGANLPLKARPKIEVGASRWWSENASIITLDKMLDKQIINVIQYLERLPDDVIPKKTELVNELKQAMMMQPQAPQLGNGVMPQTMPVMDNLALEDMQLQTADEVDPNDM